MRVEAIKREDGVLIPMLDVFRNIKHDKILLDIEIIGPVQTDEYTALDQLVGLCETKRTDASLSHDSIIYDTKDNRGLR